LHQLLLVTVLLLIPVVASAQFKLSAQVRPRTEFRNGFKTPTSSGFDPAFFTEQRSRLNIDFKDDKYAMRFSIQDVRIWGEVPQIFKEDAGTAFLSEAWGQYFVNETFSIKAGRQIISYDNQRFLGGLEWAQQGRRHDALLFINENKEKRTKLHVGLAFNADKDRPEPAYLQAPGASFYSVGGNYKALQYAWYNKTFADKKGSLSLLALNAMTQNPDSTVSSKQTFGVIPRIKAGKVTIAADVYYQTGKIGDRSVNAFLAGVNATLPTKVTPITLGFEYISGKDDDDTSTDITNFSPDYGTNHAFNGLMDYFFVGPANGNVGVLDLYLKTRFKVGKGALLLHGHEFMTGSTQLDGEGEKLSSGMGFELDAVYVRKLSPAVTLHVGASALMGTETLTTLRPGNQKFNQWAWTMITFSPTLFDSEEDKKKKKK
ncbi:MAG: alginate export family protein, partial [Bacteroidota bacterium]